jgi:hypothetical protein
MICKANSKNTLSHQHHSLLPTNGGNFKMLTGFQILKQAQKKFSGFIDIPKEEVRMV